MPDDLREKMAEQVHQCGCRWLRYIFSCCLPTANGAVLIPPEVVAKFQREIATPYPALPEEVKVNHRAEADGMIRVFNHG